MTRATPVSYEIDGNVVFLNLQGRYEPGDIKQAVQQILIDPAVPDQVRLLMDVTESVSLGERSSDDLREMATFLASQSPKFGSRLGIAAGSLLHYGMMRMAEVFSESSGLTARVFLTRDEAIAWLVDPSPE